MSDYILSKDYFVKVIEDLITLVDQRKEYYTELDSQIGDGDHGINLEIGFREVNKNLDEWKKLPVRDFYNNVGKAWTFYYELNGEKIDKAGSTADFIPGKEYTFYARIKEQDGKPDTGTNTVKYTPTESDLLNGFIVQQKVKVSENGGKYRGHSVTWTITWTIKRK